MKLIALLFAMIVIGVGYFANAMPIGVRVALMGRMAQRQAASSDSKLWHNDGAYNPLVANVYDGYVLGEDGAPVGIIQVKAAKQAVKTVTDRVTKVKTTTTNVTVTATVTDAAGKKWSYSKGDGTVDGVVTGLVCTTKGVPVPSFGVKLGANGLSGEWGDYVIEGARNGMGAKDDAMTATLDECYKKSWTVALTNELGVTRLQLVVGAKGSTKISGTTADGFKVSATVQGVMGEDAFLVPYLATVKSGKLSRSVNLLLSLGKDGTVVVRTSDLGGLKAAGPTEDELDVQPYVESDVSKGGEAYAGAVVLNDLAYPARFAAKGLPSGLKIDAATGAITGTPTKPGRYRATITVTSGLNSKNKVETTVDFDIGNYTDDLIPVKDSYGDYCVGVMVNEPIAAALGCAVSGLPAGLKFAAKETKDKTFGTVAAGTVYGVPTKAGEYTVYFKKTVKVNGKSVNHQASATFRVSALPNWAQGTFDGCVYLPPSNPVNGVANTCDIRGTITLSVTAAGKLSASVKTAKKTYSFSMASWTKFADGDAFTLEAGIELKTGEKLQLNATVRDGVVAAIAELSGGEFGDGGCVTVLAKDVYAKSGSKWIDEEAHALMAKSAGTYQFGFDAVDDGVSIEAGMSAWTLRPVPKLEAAFLKIVLKDTGVATITGTLPGKTKINLSSKATALAVDGSDKVEIIIVSAAFSGKTTTLPMEINLINDGSFAEGRTDCGIIYSVKR